MALRGCAAFNKKVNAAPPGTFTKFDVRHGSKPWTLAAIFHEHSFGMNSLMKNNKLVVSIVAVILILFVTTQILKSFVRNPKSDLTQELSKIASDVNTKAPVMIDSSRRFDGIVVLPGNKLQYNYAILNRESKDIDTVVLIKVNRDFLLNIIKTNPDLDWLAKNNVDIVAHFVDNKGAYVCTFELSHLDYK